MILPETYFICGANSVIGSEFAKYIHNKNQHLILFYHQKTDRINDLLDLGVASFQVDITDFTAFQNKIRLLSASYNFQNIGAVFFPAVRSYDHKPLRETSEDLVKEIIKVNLWGAVNFLQGILALPNVESTRIVLFGSYVSKTGLKNGSIYAATKAALANLTKSVAQEEGPNKVLINTVSPGPVETDQDCFSEDYLQFRKEYYATQKKNSCLNKIADIKDICTLVRFLTSFENNHITGEEIFITGGLF